MGHLVTLPILLPMLGAILALLPPCGKNVKIRRMVSQAFAFFTLVASLILLNYSASNNIEVYAVGNWSAPFGIVLVSDMLSTLLISLTSFLALCCIFYASAGDDEKGSFFHPLMHFLIMGVNGAFLTGDLFNLFVFFEVLLIASYSLLMHAGDKHKTRSALHYVILNLIGSSIFLIGLGVLYGVLGTLNIADMAVKVSQLTGDDVALAKIGGLLLLIVFGLKAAILPLHLWLPKTYSSALPVIAAMFAIMTKVGVYAMFRVYTIIFGEQAGELAFMAQSWLWPLAILTIAIGAIGVLASEDLRKLTANLVIISVGTLVAAISMHSVMATAAALYYVIHSTLMIAVLFLLADLISVQRGKVSDRLVEGRPVAQPYILGGGFLIAALAVMGMPPMSGFIGKIWLLKASSEINGTYIFWPVYLIASFVVLIALSRAGSYLFWRHSNNEATKEIAAPLKTNVIIALLLCSPLMVIFSGPISDFTLAAAKQLHDVTNHVNTVLAISNHGAK